VKSRGTWRTTRRRKSDGACASAHSPPRLASPRQVAASLPKPSSLSRLESPVVNVVLYLAHSLRLIASLSAPCAVRIIASPAPRVSPPSPARLSRATAFQPASVLPHTHLHLSANFSIACRD
jgi:hypothetical protein